MKSVRSVFSAASVPVSFAPMSRLYPTTSAARMAVRRRSIWGSENQLVKMIGQDYHLTWQQATANRIIRCARWRDNKSARMCGAFGAVLHDQADHKEPRFWNRQHVAFPCPDRLGLG